MSKLAKIPVTIVEGVNIDLENNLVQVSGPKGKLDFTIPEGVAIDILENRVHVHLKDKTDEERSALLGLTRAKIANMVEGVSKGYEKKLELEGVGYRAQVLGNDLMLSVGFTHPVKFTAPSGITVKVVENTIVISGADKDIVGNAAAVIRSIRPPEPYKGKGIKYKGEKIRRKAGKAAKALATAK